MIQQKNQRLNISRKSPQNAVGKVMAKATAIFLSFSGLGDAIVSRRNSLLVSGMCIEPGSKLVVLGMAIPPLMGNPYNEYINPYYWVDDHPYIIWK